ncbi:hypothetical protein QYF36_012512 [Acer negundo]|nr:hypothetical protein QYF36_012512 [Acer negundo]
MRVIKVEVNPTVNGKEDFLYRAWLRATGSIRHSNFHSHRNNFFSLINTESNWRFVRGKEKLIPEPVLDNSTISNSRKHTRKEDVMSMASDLDLKPSGALQQEEMVIKLEHVGNKEVKA